MIKHISWWKLHFRFMWRTLRERSKMRIQIQDPKSLESEYRETEWPKRYLLIHITLSFWHRNTSARGCSGSARNCAGLLCLKLIIESQDGWGGKWPLEVICSNPLGQARPHTAGCPWPCSGEFWMSPRTETPQPPWVTCVSAQSPSQ